MRSLASLFVVMSLFPTISRAQQTPDLDLTQIARPSVQESTGDVSGSFQYNSLDRIAIPPISVRLVRIEPTTCTWHEPITYDLEITNTSNAIIVLPWSVDKRDEEIPQPGTWANGFAGATLGLHVRTSGRANIGTIAALYGSQYRPFSTRTVAPGGVVRIRAGSLCNVHDDALIERILQDGMLSLPAMAMVQIEGEPGRFALVVSTEVIALTIVRP